MDSKLINNFRDAVNCNDFTFFHYSKNNDKNQWNCICSAMDWITVSVEHLKSCPCATNNIGSIQMYSYIASIDILVEAVQQLHRVIFGTKQLLFSGESDCFTGNIFNKNDLEYFKTIRACFGAHPVNLDEPGQENDSSMRRFASWSGGFFGHGDYSVILYSNQINGNDIYLSIDLAQMIAFAQKYYSYLEVLAVELQRQYDEFCLDMKTHPIKCDSTPLERLYELKKENSIRLNNDYYETVIQELILIFETAVSILQSARSILLQNQLPLHPSQFLPGLSPSVSQTLVCSCRRILPQSAYPPWTVIQFSRYTQGLSLLAHP